MAEGTANSVSRAPASRSSIFRPMHDPIADDVLAELSESSYRRGTFVNGPQVSSVRGRFRRATAGPSALRRDVERPRRPSARAARSRLDAGSEVHRPCEHVCRHVRGGDASPGSLPVPVDVLESGLRPRSGRRPRLSSDHGPRRSSPVHLYGQLADMRASARLAERHRLTSIEDCGPGARGDAATGSARARRTRCGIQLLPGQESRRDGRRRRPRDRRRSARRASARVARARPDGEVCARRGGLHGATRHDPGALPPPQAAAPRPLERRATARRGVVRGGSKASATSDFRGRPRVRPGMASLRRPTAEPERLAHFLRRARNRDRASLSRVPPHLNPAYSSLGYRGGHVPRHRGAVARMPLPSDLPGHVGGSARERRRCRTRVLRAWVTIPSTTRRTGSCGTSSSASA